MSDVTVWAVIDEVTNIVTNTIMWDGVLYAPETPTGWIVPDGMYTLEVGGIQCQIGDVYDPETKTFTRPDPVPNPEEVIPDVVSE